MTYARRRRWLWAMAGATLGAHLVINALSVYTLHRDALLYLAMGRHLDLFRMDFPPFIAMVAELTRALFGDSVFFIRLGPAAAHAAVVWIAGWFALRAGGGTWAAVLACVAVATGPVYLRAGSLFQPVVFDQLWWLLGLLLLTRIAAAPWPPDSDVAAGAAGKRGWVAFGVVAGLGLLTKFTMLVFGAGVLVGIIASPLRRWLRTPWPWLAAGIALVIGSPSFVGQARLGWPFVGQLADLQSSQLERVGPGDFLGEQFLMVGPLTMLIAAAGMASALTRPVLRDLRVVGWTCATALLLMVAAGGKAYYIAPIWPALIGIGFAAVSAWATTLKRRLMGGDRGGTAARYVRPAVLGLVTFLTAAWGVVALPMGAPVLPPEPMAAYANRLGATQALTTNTGERLTLPQDYADMLGWPELADSVAAVYHRLPRADRERAVILATNYGRAGAVDFFGRPLGLPPAVAPIGSYWFWGPGELPGDVTIVVGAEPDDLGPFFRRRTLAARVLRPWGVPEEQDVGIVVAREPVRPLQQVWPEFRGAN